MALTNEFIEAVESGKKVRVRIMLKDIMLVDPTMRTFDEMIKYAASKMNDVYDEHDGEQLKYDTMEWNESYLSYQMVTVVNNFSKERIELLRSMVKYLYKDKANKMKEETEYKSSGVSRKQIGAGVAVAGAAVAVVGICASEGLMVAGGVALAAAGVVMIVTDKE